MIENCGGNCGQTACIDCNPVDQSCPEPTYTEENCFPAIETTCVINKDLEDTCIPIQKDMKLSSILSNITKYIKKTFTRLTPDDSLEILPVDDECGDKIIIKAKISEELGNGLSLKEDGLFAEMNGGGGNYDFNDTDSIKFTTTPGEVEAVTANLSLDGITGDGDNAAVITENGLYVPPAIVDCEKIQKTFEAIFDQRNAIQTDQYSFNVSGPGGCGSISAPTAFAVSGQNRKSAFGKMEWFQTFNDANTSAQAGETVMLYNDVTGEIIPKNGVNYFGFGLRNAFKFTVLGSAPYSGTLSNIVFTDDVYIDSNFANNKSVITAHNVTIKGNFTIEGYSVWNGGRLIGNTKRNFINEDAYVRNIFTDRETDVNDGATLVDSDFHDEGSVLFINSFLNVKISVSGRSSGPNISGCRVYSKNNSGINVLSMEYPGVSMSHCRSVSIEKNGILWHEGSQPVISSSKFSHCVGISVNGNGIQKLQNGDSADANTVNHYAQVGTNEGYSVNGYGVYSISSCLRNFYGYSENQPGIKVAGSDFAYINTTIVNCIGESRYSHGLHATRDIHILGGHYITHSKAGNVSPVFIGPTNVTRPNQHYYIAGAVLESALPTDYKINGDMTILPISVRIGRNIFICSNGAASVNTIGPTLIPNMLPFVFDSYGNMFY